MTMDHKAFVLAHAHFEAELRPILERALERGETDELAAFVVAHRGELRDPDTGAPLDDERVGALEDGDVQAYGDVALTRYYDPAQDIGLSTGWESIDTLLVAHNPTWIPFYTGDGIGPDDWPFDPGGQGAFVQTAAQVHQHLHALDELLARLAPDERAVLAPLRAMLAAADARGEGLYTTF